MKITVLRVAFLAFATIAVAQCPVSGDASTCTTPTPSSTKPVGKATKAAAKPSAASQSKTAVAGKAAEAAPADSEPLITRTQADAILVELKEIHTLLQKQQPAGSGIDYSKIDFNGTPVVKVSPAHHWDSSMGGQDAPVEVVEYSDYQCSHCARVHTEMFDAIKKKYIDTGKVRFESRDLPLPFHPWAMMAAEASHCAGEQGKYWQMRDWLMRHSEGLSPDVIEQGARSLPVDMTEYQICMESRKYYTSVKADAESAMDAQVVATPAFIVGKNNPEGTEGKRKLGVGSVAELEALIDEALGTKK